MSPPDLAPALAQRGWAFYGLTTRDRPQREQRLRREFARVGLPVHVHVADRPQDAHGFASPGAWGCFAGHLALLERALDERVEVAVIAEDDVVLPRAFRRHVVAVADELAALDPGRWSTAYLGHLPASPARSAGLRLVAPHLAQLEGWEVHGAHLYVVHRAALGPLLEDFRARLLPGGHRIPADGVLNEHRRDSGHDTLVALPVLGHQAPSPSGITRGSGRTAALKDALLARPRVQPLVEQAKRLGWDVVGAAPVARHVRAWERGARRRAAAGVRPGGAR